MPHSDCLSFTRVWSAKETLVKLGLLRIDDFDLVDYRVLAEQSNVRLDTYHLTDADIVVSLARQHAKRSAETSKEVGFDL